MNPDWRFLLARLMDGDALSPEEEATLAGALEREETGAEALELLRFERALHDRLRNPDPAEAARSMERLLAAARLREARLGRRRAARRRTIIRAAAAATILIGAASAAWIALRGRPQPALAAVEAADGASILRPDGSTRPATPGTTIGTGDRITTAPDGSAKIVWSDRTARLELGGASELIFQVPSPGKRALLQSGSLAAAVDPQPAGLPAVFATPHAEAVVLGTRLALEAGRERTRLEVIEGRVRLERKADGAAVTVTAGCYSIADLYPSGPMAVFSAAWPPQQPAADPRRPAAEAIRLEALRPNNDTLGRPLPLASRWGIEMYNGKGYERPAPFLLEWQVKQIESGRHILPFIDVHPHTFDALSGDKAAVEACGRLKLPLSLLAPQWEKYLSELPAYLNLPPEENPNVVGPDGRIERRVSPMGPVKWWTDVGKKFTSETPERPGRIRALQKWYPDPPLVAWISNNEHGKLGWNEAEKDRRYLSRHGAGRPAEFRKKTFGGAWLERYRALQEGMRQGLESAAWRERSIFVGYDAFLGYDTFRWGGWTDYCFHEAGKSAESPLWPFPQMWTGASPSYYAHDWNGSTDKTLWSPQVGCMSWPFMVEEAIGINPNFWWEISTWDGSVKKREFYAKGEGRPYTPERYQGYIQFGMWLLRPRVVREFQFYETSTELIRTHFLKICDAVDRVHAHPVLRRFWRKGELVPHQSQKHPWQANVPPAWRDKHRWFLLDASANPPYPWTDLGTHIPVFAIALSLGMGADREWLLYAHSPVKACKDVEVTLPGFGRLRIDTAPEGVFYHVRQGKAPVPLRFD